MSDHIDVKPVLAQNLFSVNGLTAVITGGGSGLGAYMARALAINGASKVFILGRREEALNRTKSSLPEEYAKAVIPVIADVSTKQTLAEAYKTITETHGLSELDVLICNSGVSGPAVKTEVSTIAELSKNMLAPSEGDINDTFGVNSTGVHLTVATFLPLLDAANKARPTPNATNYRPRPQIITTSSIGGLHRRPLGGITYGPSKAAVIHLTKQLSTVLIPHDIRANTIAPGLYLSEMTEGMYKSQGIENHSVEGSVSKDVVPANRGGDEQDMAGVILFLCSRAGGYVNGCVVVTDGGRLGMMPATY